MEISARLLQEKVYRMAPLVLNIYTWNQAWYSKTLLVSKKKKKDVAVKVISTNSFDSYVEVFRAGIPAVGSGSD